MQVKVLRALDDNYMYLVIDDDSKETAVVDPVEPEKVLKEVAENGLNLTTILTTHHHWDHAGGNEKLLNMTKEKGISLSVYGGDDRIYGVVRTVQHGEMLKVGNLVINCLFTPCHTSGHICYYVQDPSEEGAPGSVFTGDTLFLGGCGKFFEGNPQQMYTALVEILGSLPGNTKVYCGHEYAVNNLKYAAHAQPKNRIVSEKMAWALRQQEKNEITVPSTIDEEKSYNPFMRVHETELQDHAGSCNPVEVMGFLRFEKDRFRK